LEKEDYPKKLTDKLIQVIGEAHKQSREIVLECNTTEQRGLSFNRRFHMKDGTVVFNPGKKNTNIVAAAGPIDPEVGILSLKNKNGMVDAILTIFALHLDTVGGTLYSADYPYFLEQELRSSIQPNLISIFGNGTCGDINHINVETEDRQHGVDEAKRIGTILGKTVSTAVTHSKSLAPRLAVQSKKIPYPLQTVSAEKVKQAREMMILPGQPFLVQVDLFKTVSIDSRKNEPFKLEVQVFRLDKNTAIVSLPGEVFVDIGLAIKKKSPFKNTFVVELANDSIHYVPTVKAFKEGSYEVVNSIVQPGGGEAMVDAAVEMLHDLAR
jgi:neutral ceramidase